GPAHGQATLNSDGHYTYAPAEDFNGEDSFQVTAADAGGNASARATFPVTVAPVDDEPVCQPKAMQATVGARLGLPVEERSQPLRVRAERRRNGWHPASRAQPPRENLCRQAQRRGRGLSPDQPRHARPRDRRPHHPSDDPDEPSQEPLYVSRLMHEPGAGLPGLRPAAPPHGLPPPLRNRAPLLRR